ncbi:MAG: DNA polymerase [Carboxydocellales bacterium]
MGRIMDMFSQSFKPPEQKSQQPKKPTAQNQEIIQPEVAIIQPKEYRLILEGKDIIQQTEAIAEAKIFRWDIETAPKPEFRDMEKYPKAALDPYMSDICGMSFSYCPNKAFYIPISHKNGPNFMGGGDEIRSKLIQWLRPILNSREIHKNIFNSAFEQKFLTPWRLFIKKPLFDPFVAAIFINQYIAPWKVDKHFPEKGFGLKRQGKEILGVDRPDYSELLKHFGVNYIDEVPSDDPMMIEYGCADADDTGQLEPYWRGIAKQIPKYEDYLDEIECPMNAVVGIMEATGMSWDVDTMKVRLQEAEIAVEKAAEEIQNLAGRPIKVGQNGGTADMKNLIYQDLGLPKHFTAKEGLSLDILAIQDIILTIQENPQEGWPDNALPILEALKRIKKADTLRGTHIEGRLKYAHPVKKDGMTWIRSGYRTTTDTGRLSSHGPNGQNTPRPENDDFGIRKLAVAPEGKKYLCIDQSGFELKILAWQSQDPAMIEVQNTGGDIHRKTAAAANDIPEDQVTKVQRQDAKPVNFGVGYGISEDGLIEDALRQGKRLTKEKARLLMKGVFKAFPRIADYQCRIVEYAITHGYVTTIFGKRRPVPDITSPNRHTRSHAENVAKNTPIQASAADIMKKAQVDIVNEDLLDDYPGLDMAAQIHDEFLFIVDEQIILEVAKKVKEIMERPIPGFNVKLVAEPAAHRVWGEKKGIEL